jgi:hypothetical protein
MKYPLSELIDRYSILLLKQARLPGGISTYESSQFQEAIQQSGIKYQKLVDWIDDFKEINGRIWDLESDIRRGKENILGLEEVGRRALAIRDINKERIALKNKIAAQLGEFEDIKVDHRSA